MLSPEAADLYRKLIKKYSGKTYLAFGGYMGMGSYHLGKGEFAEAAKFFADAAARYPGHFNAPAALTEAGRAYRKAGMVDLAKRSFRRVLSEYPKSRSATDVRTDLEELEFMP